MGNGSQNNTINSPHTALNRLSTVLFYLAILFFIIGFGFKDSVTGNWYQQFLPNLNGAQISDITFVDSLNGFFTTLYRTGNDSAYILKTINGGDNWSVNTVYNYPFYRVQFINQDTGYALSFQKLFKTTNKGITWQIINIALSTAFVNIYVLNRDTIWGVASESISGGIFFTSNGGTSWQQQLSQGTANPDKIYMFNARIGYANRNGGSYMYKTTNSGLNWLQISGTDGFLDIHFVDSLTGWKCSVSGGFMKKTTNGGLNWVTQTLPSGGIIQTSGLSSFSNVNRDTIWGNGGYVLYPNSQVRQYLLRTTNGGTNWLLQIPDTSINIGYSYVNFFNKYNGWCYDIFPTGIHTVTGGDTTFLVPVNQISNEIPKEFKLFQNYPNPFNPQTVISYQLRVNSYVKLVVYNIQGKEIAVLVDQKQTAGTYRADFSGSNLSSGVYFYQLTVNNEQSVEVYKETKKMLLIK